jgi:hypothetical protein
VEQASNSLFVCYLFVSIFLPIKMQSIALLA